MVEDKAVLGQEEVSYKNIPHAHTRTHKIEIGRRDRDHVRLFGHGEFSYFKCNEKQNLPQGRSFFNFTFCLVC